MVTDNLRDRIAKAVGPHLVDMDAKAVADAVIEALKTDPSIMFMTHVCGEGCSCE